MRRNIVSLRGRCEFMKNVTSVVILVTCFSSGDLGNGGHSFVVKWATSGVWSVFGTISIKWFVCNTNLEFLEDPSKVNKWIVS